jgi:aspartate aminotransferase-like enzyme
VLRNGWFSYRWTQIFETCHIPSAEVVLKATPNTTASDAAWSPAAIESVVATIRAEKPALVFAPHVETASGIILPDAYIKAVSDAVHEVGGLFVLDCVASGTVWIDMQATGVDVLISAPQKGWSSTPCAAMVMLSEAAKKHIEETTSTSFAVDLKRWMHIMQSYESGSHAYHATMPTDALIQLRDTMKEMEKIGFDVLKDRQWELGQKVRAMLAAKGIKSVAAEGFAAPGVVVSHTKDHDIHTGKKFLAQGMQAAAGVPLKCDEPEGFQTFRIGLFGLDKLMNVDATVNDLERVMSIIL